MGLSIKMMLPENFLKEEIRCGYTVSSKLKKSWAIELDLLNELMRVCQKHHIKMQVSYGTLLGAVRHKGFIPWDDDLDVWLTRDQYNKLLEVAPHEFKSPYFLQTALNDRQFYLPYARLRNSETTGIIYGQESLDYNNGIYVDVYVIDGFVESRFLFYIQLIFRRITTKCLTLYYQDGSRSGRCGLIRNVLKIFRPFIRWVKFDTWFRLNNRILAFYNKSARRFSIVYEMCWKPYTHWITREELADTISIPFENLMIPAPRRYDEVLRRMYGDYMTFPPPDQRGKWHEGKIRFEPDIPYKEFLRQNK